MKKYWRFQYPAHGGGAGLEALKRVWTKETQCNTDKLGGQNDNSHHGTE